MLTPIFPSMRSSSLIRMPCIRNRIPFPLPYNFSSIRREMLFVSMVRSPLSIKVSNNIFFRYFGSSQKKEQEYTFSSVVPEKDFDGWGGYPEIVDSFVTLAPLLQQNETLTYAKPPQGIILIGPPGTGKTELVERFAGQLNLRLFKVSGSEFQEKYLGESEKKIRALFEQAKELAPCIVFIDEIESIGGNRERERLANYVISVTNELLSCLSSKPRNVFFMAATNNVKQIDPALLRPGRLDRHIHIPLPNVKDRVAILEVHTRDKQLAPEVCLETLAAFTEGYSGAKLATLVNEAAISALREERPILTKEDFDHARIIMTMGVARSSMVTPAERRGIAIHEVGHALVGEFLGHKIYELNLYQYGETRGHTAWYPSNQGATYQALANQICILLAGRANEIVWKTVQMGSDQDLARARGLALKMVQEEAMGLTLLRGTEEEVESLLQEQMHRAISILEKVRLTSERLVEALMTHNVLDGDLVRQIMKGEEVDFSVVKKKSLPFTNLKKFPPRIKQEPVLPLSSENSSSEDLIFFPIREIDLLGNESSRRLLVYTMIQKLELQKDSITGIRMSLPLTQNAKWYVVFKDECRNDAKFLEHTVELNGLGYCRYSTEENVLIVFKEFFDSLS